MATKILIDEQGLAEALDSSTGKIRKRRATDPNFPKGRKFGGATKYVYEEVLEYARSLPKLEPGERGLRGHDREPEAAA